jgi:hypothetical protein
MQAILNILSASKLQGYRTYIIAGIVILAVASEKLIGIDIPGFEVGDDWLGFVLAALGLGSAKAAAVSAAADAKEHADAKVSEAKSEVKAAVNDGLAAAKDEGLAAIAAALGTKKPATKK